ncbi:hypothetical protein H4R35_001411 [Dimargaris xerosporica]|nr:hypothetical protein H4R35_001411 [Dimargaris xerosporica]
MLVTRLASPGVMVLFTAVTLLGFMRMTSPLPSGPGRGQSFLPEDDNPLGLSEVAETEQALSDEENAIMQAQSNAMALATVASVALMPDLAAFIRRYFALVSYPNVVELIRNLTAYQYRATLADLIGRSQEQSLRVYLKGAMIYYTIPHMIATLIAFGKAMQVPEFLNLIHAIPEIREPIIDLPYLPIDYYQLTLVLAAFTHRQPYAMDLLHYLQRKQAFVSPQMVLCIQDQPLAQHILHVLGTVWGTLPAPLSGVLDATNTCTHWRRVYLDLIGPYQGETALHFAGSGTTSQQQAQ